MSKKFKRFNYQDHSDFIAWEKSNYVLFVLDRVLWAIEEKIDYDDIDIRNLLIDVHQAAISYANLDLRYVISESEGVQAKLYKGMEIMESI